MKVENQLSLHYATNNYVEPTGRGNWELYPYAVIINAADIKKYLRLLDYTDTISDYGYELDGIEICLIVPEDMKEKIIKILNEKWLTKNGENIVVSYKRPTQEQFLNPKKFPNIFEEVSEFGQNVIYEKNIREYFLVEKIPLDYQNNRKYKIIETSGFSLARIATENKLINILKANKKDLIYMATHDGITKLYMLDVNNSKEKCYINDAENFYKGLHNFNINPDGNILDEGRRKLVNIIKQIDNKTIVKGQSMIDRLLLSTGPLTRFNPEIIDSIEYVFGAYIQDLLKKPPFAENFQTEFTKIVMSNINKSYAQFLNIFYQHNIHDIHGFLIDSVELIKLYFDASDILSDTEDKNKYENFLKNMKEKYTIHNKVQSGGAYYAKYQKYKNKYLQLKKLNS